MRAVNGVENPRRVKWGDSIRLDRPPTHFPSLQNQKPLTTCQYTARPPAESPLKMRSLACASPRFEIRSSITALRLRGRRGGEGGGEGAAGWDVDEKSIADQ